MPKFSDSYNFPDEVEDKGKPEDTLDISVEEDEVDTKKLKIRKNSQVSKPKR